MSTNSTSPEEFLGGKWEQIKDVFLLSAGDTYTAGTTGGESTHKLTISEMPKHRHSIKASPLGDGGNTFRGSSNYPGQHTVSVDYAGGDEAHNNMPPYLTVYMWQRIE